MPWENTLHYVKCTSSRFGPTLQLSAVFPSPLTGKTEIPGFDVKVMNVKKRFLGSEYMSRGKLCKSSHFS